MKKLSPTQLKAAHAVAKEARQRAYAPYSKFQVGAALVLADGSILPGCNVENASFGGTVCAERTAIFSAVAQKGKTFQAQAIVLVTEPEAVPCGLCLQVMAEFCAPDMPVYLGSPKAPGKAITFGKLLPHSFEANFLRKK